MPSNHVVMIRRAAPAVLVLLGAVAGAACSDDAEPLGEVSETTAAAPADATTVDIAGFAFSPPDLDVPVGGSVTWTNSHTQAHTATSAGAFDTKAIAPGESATVTFDAAGSYSYICSFHPFMKGTITVG